MEDTIRIGSCVFVEGDRFFSWRGDSISRNRGKKDNENDLQILEGNEWKFQTTTGDIPRSVTGCGATVINGKVILFGGFDSEAFGFNATYFRDLFELNLDTFKWKRLIPINDEKEGPMKKYIFGIGSLNESVLIFGGFGHKGSHSQPWSQYDWSIEFNASWTNELHLYNPATNMWICPVIEGIKPSPCAAFCFTKIDKTRFLMFGGRQLRARVNEVQILDTATWSWSGPILPTGVRQEQWPIPRSLHTGVSLIDPDSLNPPIDGRPAQGLEQSVLALWGQDHASDYISDVWILKVNSLKWEKLESCHFIGRKWHSTAAMYPSSGESVIVTFGGISRSLLKENTAVMRFGVANLYTLCLRYFNTYCHKPSKDLLSYLPARVSEDIKRAQVTINDSTHYNLVANVVEEKCK